MRVMHLYPRFPVSRRSGGSCLLCGAELSLGCPLSWTDTVIGRSDHVEWCVPDHPLLVVSEVMDS